ncbi:TetR/AcrR family transcriptional regulator [Promicromonospora citrea]|uniref:TetR family transcriptional regulator n=1 Tax=Promicromonospora citrea TaxID=43677 RepID=A0A8H9GH63_9MICO|nr:TetR/AcrR family transcriptional regulator [Promicromonospora citrea]NNH51612.1 TetR/AcrR family transcriptional regulator [Promicromonospora citrea]GGM22413.1 TetR family transcriptional regulator [Promicromonospora citrea]
MAPTTPRETDAPALGLRELADALEGTPAERGLRERKKRSRRLALIDAAQELVAEHGLDAVTVEMISAQAGVSPRTFFNYFESKDDAVLGAEDAGLPDDVVGTFVDGGPTGRLLSDVQVLVAALLATADEGHDRVRRAVDLVQQEPRLLQRHMAWLDRHQKRLGEIFEARRAAHPFSTDTELLNLLVLMLLRTSLAAWERAGCTGRAADHLPSAVSQLLDLAAGDVAP